MVKTLLVYLLCPLLVAIINTIFSGLFNTWLVSCKKRYKDKNHKHKD